VKPLDCNHVLMSTMTSAAEAVRADVLPREPRCRICRDPDVRRLANDLLAWRGVPLVPDGRIKRHRITYTDILDWLEPLNEGRDEKDRITYDCLWTHAKRHYHLDGLIDYWTAWFYREMRKALGGAPIEWL
jgi:hypothetical protein